MKVALCQLGSSKGDVEANADRIVRTVMDNDADLYVLPELFLTGYSVAGDFTERVESSLNRISDVCREAGTAVIVGAPVTDSGKTYDAAMFISDSIREYRKIHLAQFQYFKERDMFESGSEPCMVEHKGMKIGLSICYDMFFPELFKHYSMNGCSLNVCISASPMTSKDAFARVLPARSVENGSYTVYVNSVGYGDSMKYFGGSRCISPSGETLFTMNDMEGLATVCIDMDEVEEARRLRPVLRDTRRDIVW